MLPAVCMPPEIIHCDSNEFCTSSSLCMYLAHLKSPTRDTEDARLFLEAVPMFDWRDARVLHTPSSSAAFIAANTPLAACDSDATHIFAASTLYDAVQLLDRQRLGGSLIATIGDTVMRSEVQLVYILCASYSAVRIYQRNAHDLGSRRLLVCTGYRRPLPALPPPPYKFEMSMLFLSRLDEINSMNGQARFDAVRLRYKGDWRSAGVLQKVD